jgi:hypothetical protein
MATLKAAVPATVSKLPQYVILWMASCAFCFGVRGTGTGESRNRLKKFDRLGQDLVGWPELPVWATGAGQRGLAVEAISVFATVPTGWGASGSGADPDAAVS